MPAIRSTELALARVAARRRNAVLYLSTHTDFFSDLECCRRCPEAFRDNLSELYPEMQDRLKKEEENQELMRRRNMVGGRRVFCIPDNLPQHPPGDDSSGDSDDNETTIRIGSILDDASEGRRDSGRESEENEDEEEDDEVELAREYAVEQDEIRRRRLGGRGPQVAGYPNNIVGRSDAWLVSDSGELWRPPPLMWNRDNPLYASERPPHAPFEQSLAEFRQRVTRSRIGTVGSIRGESESDSGEDLVVEYADQKIRRQNMLIFMHRRFIDGFDDDYFDYESADYNKHFND
eukprot:Plantae.Rhodophyta-Hildenbrandia_rubra.ctg6209.p1 GENE.Plantae.Rhodophyta-Hildenbrandia_rubra.ctg6209~~Plantae.Rhodophyta-Hildenbrandia_rubra.ctg6209.p1  ORF type:complete len:337 (-),score=78.38 Plantae.Rhodophyta-Hildenbrandia_rubra.ctg6209:867-1739(-)